MIYEEKLKEVLHKVTNPARYIGHEYNSINKKWDKEKSKVVLAFPDLYEIGMSHLGLKILYHLLNEQDDILAERCFAPWLDMEEVMGEEKIPLFSLESKHELKDFDILGFTLQYELSYTNIINMLDLANLPIYSQDRGAKDPLVIGGGSTVFNPEPLAAFFDLFYIGEAEEGIVNLVREYSKLKNRGLERKEILRHLSKIAGVYVPSLYKLSYDHNGQIKNIKAETGIKSEIKRQIVPDLDKAFYPTKFIVPYLGIVHDRAVLEVARGCTRACRFCAAGMVYRPVRERKKTTLLKLADQILKNTGYEEISLNSLSIADYSQIEDLVKTMSEKYESKKISLTLPSLRIDSFSVDLAHAVQRVRKSGLTFAVEAGTQRLRDVINKGVKETDLLQAVEAAFHKGWSTIKLYFMLGLPTETEKDLAGIVTLVKKVLKMAKEHNQQKKRGRRINIQVSVSTFVPKPFTPFQVVKMISKEEINHKQNYLKENLKIKGVNFSWNEADLSLLEAAFARGDRRLAKVIVSAWQKGAKFDGWDEVFNFQAWQAAFRDNDLKLADYLRARDWSNLLAWDHIKVGVSKKFLKKEYEKSLTEETTADCRFADCNHCNLCPDFAVQNILVGDEQNDSKM